VEVSTTYEAVERIFFTNLYMQQCPIQVLDITSTIGVPLRSVTRTQSTTGQDLSQLPILTQVRVIPLVYLVLK